MSAPSSPPSGAGHSAARCRSPRGGVVVFALLRAGLGSLTLPVAVYVAVITVMMWRAAARVGSPRHPALAAWLGIAGAVAFGASDTLIAFNRFLEPIPGVRVPILLLYWLGQWGIAGSAALAYRDPANR